MAELVDLDEAPQGIEIYDNSHIQGTNALGAMVVAGPEVWIKGAYRKFNIKRAETQPGDDFAMMREVFQRRFARALEEDPERTKGRSEEHTSELQSLMRISYAVFCLKKKTNTTIHQH